MLSILKTESYVGASSLDLSTQKRLLQKTVAANSFCQVHIFLGDGGAHDLNGDGGDFSLVMKIDGWVVQPSPQVATFDDVSTQAALCSLPFAVPAGAVVEVYLTSPNAGDTSVACVTQLFDVSPVTVNASGHVTLADGSLSAAKLAVDALAAIAAAIWKIDFDGITGEADFGPINALRKLRDRIAIEDDVLTVYKEDGTTPAFTQLVTGDANAEPIVALGNPVEG